MKRLVPIFVATLALFFLVATPAAGVTTSAGPLTSSAAVTTTHVYATLGEMWIHTVPVTRAGSVTFTVKNVGAVTHEMVVIRTDLPDGTLPPDPVEANKVSEKGSVGESGDVAPGATAEFTLTLTPGRYALICNEPGHYAAGMHTTLVVASYVGLTLNEMTITSDVASVPAGPVIFGVANTGAVTHEVVVIRTDLPEGKLPPDPTEAGKVSEAGSAGETGDIDPGRWGSALLWLNPGAYSLICNEPGHYAAGMHMAFTVTAAVAPAAPAPAPAPVATPAPTPQPLAAGASNTNVSVTLGEMWIRTIPVARAGNVTFTVKNIGAVTHEMVVIRTDIPDGQLPPDPVEANKVSESGSVGESGDVNAGATTQFTLTLTPGRYALICNEPGHYAAGMHTTLVVASYVGLTLNEMTITANTASVAAGPVIFGVANTGAVTHEVVVIRTDLPEGKLPPDPVEAGKVSEDGSVGETSDISSGRWGSVLLWLNPGAYSLICNEPGHYAAGMHMAFTVK